MADRIPAERLQVGDRVRAVLTGPVGEVVDVGRSEPTWNAWTLVNYGPEMQVSYKHGRDGLYLVNDR